MIRSLRNLALVAGLFTTMTQAQSFEGVIEFKKTSGPVVTSYKYYVKGDHVRIEEVSSKAVSYTHLRANETVLDLVCRLLLEKNKNNTTHTTPFNLR